VGGSGRGCGSALARHFWLLPLLLLLFPQQSLQKEVNNKIHQTSNITTFVSIAVRAAMLDLSSSASSQMIIIPWSLFLIVHHTPKLVFVHINSLHHKHWSKIQNANNNKWNYFSFSVWLFKRRVRQLFLLAFLTSLSMTMFGLKTATWFIASFQRFWRSIAFSFLVQIMSYLRASNRPIIKLANSPFYININVLS